MSYRVEISPSAQRELRRLDSGVRERILRSLIRLETEQRPPGAKKLRTPIVCGAFGLGTIELFMKYAIGSL